MLVEAMRLASISASAVTARRMRPEALEIAETDETWKNLALGSSNTLHHVSRWMTLHHVAKLLCKDVNGSTANLNMLT